MTTKDDAEKAVSVLSQAVIDRFAKMHNVYFVVDAVMVNSQHREDLLVNILVDIGDRLGFALKAWNDALPEEERHTPEWLVEKAKEGVEARINDSLYMALKERMGLQQRRK